MKKVIAFSLAFTPMLLLAANITNINDAFTAVQGWMKTITIMIFAAAVIYFLYAVFKFIKNPGDAKAREEARAQIIWGLIGLTIMASVYALINFLGSSTVGIGGTPVAAPTLPF